MPAPLETARKPWRRASRGQRRENVRRTPARADRSDLDPEADDDWEDDWSEGQAQQQQRRPLGPAELRERCGISEEEAALWDRGAEQMFETGKFPEDIRQELKKFSSSDGLDGFRGVGGGPIIQQWIDVPLNDTWTVRVAQVAGAEAKFINMMRTETVVSNETLDMFTDGDSFWPGAVILARWMAIHPPVVRFAGKTVVELGAGLGLPGILAARLGADHVLLQDRTDPPLQEAVRTAAENDVMAKISTLRCRWQDMPTRLLSASEDVLQVFADADIFLGADVLFSEAAATEVADLLAELLRRSDQVAYIADPYKRAHRRVFTKLCRSHGLELSETEIVTWEPEGNTLETDEEWVCILIAVCRM